MSNLDEKTVAAVKHLLRGDGVSRNGTYVVTVRGGRIVGVAPVGERIPTERLQDHDKLYPRVNTFPAEKK